MQVIDLEDKLGIIVLLNDMKGLKYYLIEKQNSSFGIVRDFIFNTNFNFIREFSCVSKLDKNRKISCSLLTNLTPVQELIFEYSSSLLKISETATFKYKIFKDFFYKEILSNSYFIAVRGWSLELNKHAVLVYQKNSTGGSDSLFAGLDLEEISPRGEINLFFYDYNGKSQIFAQEIDGDRTIVYNLGNISLEVLQKDQGLVSRINLVLDGVESKASSVLSNYFTAATAESTEGLEESKNARKNNENEFSSLIPAILYVTAFVFILFVLFGLGLLLFQKKIKKKREGVYRENKSRDASQINLELSRF